MDSYNFKFNIVVYILTSFTHNLIIPNINVFLYFIEKFLKTLAQFVLLSIIIK